MRVIWQCENDAVAAVVLGHGAGAGMSHPNMQAIADAFSRKGLATLRFDFPFIEAGRKRADSAPVAIGRIAEAMAAASERTALPLWLGGHSFGGRMASHAVLERQLTPRGLIFCSFPLHTAGRADTSRAQHLTAVRLPMLFLSGTRDRLARPELLQALVTSLPTAQLHWLDTADHGYRVLKRSRQGTENVFEEMARAARAFVDRAGPFMDRAGPSRTEPSQTEKAPPNAAR